MATITSDVVILTWPSDHQSPSTADGRASDIVSYMGVEPTTVSLTKAALAGGASIRNAVPKCICLIADAETLAAAVDAMPAGIGELSNLVHRADHLFVYNFQPNDRHRAILRTLTSAGLRGVQPVAATGSKFQVSTLHREWTGQFSGLDVRAVDLARDYSFVDGNQKPEQTILVRNADRPFFVLTKYGPSDVFLVACSELADLNQTITTDAGLLPWFSSLAPLLMMLRGALKDRAWHSDISQACFIIDDPLLKRKYGFLDYAKLVETMRPHKFSASIAFIPWNYRRSNKKIVHMFSNGPFPLSVCVHGCDHIRAEFASTDSDVLRGKAKLALHRMRAHQKTHGLQFNDVMVFPQGLFSAESLAALDSCSYLAAINTTVFPVNKQKALTLRNLLDVAVTAFGGVPLFARHYPKDPAEFAFDLFLGKPAFLVEHHGYFRRGYGDLRTFAKRLNEVDSELQWLDPGTVCSRASLQRTTPSGVIEVRFFTSRFSLANNTDQTQSYHLIKLQVAGSPVSVTVNGHPWAEKQKEGKIELGITLEAGERANVNILSKENESDPNSAWKPTSGHNARVLIRRVLSEVRDDRVDTNGFFHSLLSGAHKLRSRGAVKA